MWQVWETRDVNKGFWLQDLTGRHHLEDIRIDGKILLKWVFRVWN